MSDTKKSFMSESPLSGDAHFQKIEADRRSAAVLLLTTLALGVIRKKFPHLVDAPISPPSIAERREIMNLLLKMTDAHTLALGGRDHVIDEAIKRGKN